MTNPTGESDGEVNRLGFDVVERPLLTVSRGRARPGLEYSSPFNAHRENGSVTQVSIIGLDLAKNVFQVHGAAADRSPLSNRKLRRAEVLRFFERTPLCLVAMEACGGSHHWAREIRALGHDVRLIPPVYVKPFVKRGKTDVADAEAICEAASRKTMRFVPVKTAEQQAGAMVLKTRALLVRQQTQAINALRGHLSELGVVAGVGMAKLATLMEIMRDKNEARLPEAARFALGELATALSR